MLRSKYIRLFVSSTFEDMARERNILQKSVFPRITKLCQSKGWIFEDIDLRWGISQEASRQQKTMRICLEELKRCKQFSPKPNFLILLGDRSGWIPLPESIPASDGECILSMARGDDRALFEQWYYLDTNSIRGEYILQERNGIYLDYERYEEEVASPLRQLFRRFVQKKENVEKRLLYEGSATMQEIYHGALSVKDAQKHVVLYSRILKDVPKPLQHKYCDTEKSLFGFLGRKSSHDTFKDTVKNALSYVYEKRLSYEELQSEGYAHEFEERIYAYLERIVLEEIEQNTILDQIEFDREASLDFISERNSFFVGREDDIKSISDMIHGADGKPIAVTGPSGIGKSSLISKVTETCSKDMTVLSRFIGHAFSRASGIEMLHSIWLEMDRYGKYDKEFSVFNFSERIQKSSYDIPVLIAIDGIDQFSDDDEFLSMNWLPEKLEGNVRIIYSVLDRPEYRTLYQRCGVSQYALAPLDYSSAMDYIDLKLKKLGRNLTREQFLSIRDAVNKSDKLPIYLNLVSHFASQLRSFDQSRECPTEATKLLFLFFDDLAKQENHGELLTKKVFSYLVTAKYGISHSELREILASNDEYWSFFLQSAKHIPETVRIPSSIVVRLLCDLSNFTNQQSIFDGVLTYFNHRIVTESVYGWLVSRNSGYSHEELFRYYDSKWRENDLHSIYEVSYQALKYNEHTAFELYTNLDYAIIKIQNSASDILRSDLYKVRTSADMNIFIDFDIEAKAYAMTLDKTESASSVKNKIIGLAANWSKGSIVRKSFERSDEAYPSMVNTMAPNDYTRYIYTPLPFAVNDSAVISDDGLYIIWNQEGNLYLYNRRTITTIRIVSDYRIDQFWVSDDFAILIALNDNSIIIYDIADDRIRNMYTINNAEIHDPILHFKQNHDFVLVFRNLDSIYKLYSSTFEKVLLTRYPINPNTSFQMAGFLKDGDWIVLVMDVTKKENNEEHCYKCLLFYELSDKLIYKHESSAKWDMHKLSYPFAISCSGHNLVVSAMPDKFRDNICVHDFSSNQIRTTMVTLGHTYGRGHTYAVHISKDEMTFWAINGGMRMILFDLSTRCNKNVINTSGETKMFKASANNRRLLFTSDTKGSFNGSRLYDSILNPDNIAEAVDYFPSQLSTISSDARAEHIFTSHGWDIQVNLEGATMFEISPDAQGFSRKEYNNIEDNNIMFATCTAVSKSGERAVYSRRKINEHIWNEKVNHYEVPESKEDCIWPFYISRMEYTPDDSAILALPGFAIVSTNSKGYLFITDSEKGKLPKHIIDLPEHYSFTHSTISNNGKYALVWSGDHTCEAFMGLRIDLCNNRIAFQLPQAVDMKFFPDGKASMQTVIAQLTKSKKYGIPPAVEFGTTIIDNFDTDHEKSLRLTESNVALGDISPSGRFYICMDYSLAKGTRVFNSLNKMSLCFDEHVHACRITYDDIHMFVICDTVIYLVYIPQMRIIQKFQMNYIYDNGNRKNSFGFMKHLVTDERLVDNTKEMIHNSRHFQLYDKGLLISDWDHIFRIEPDNYKINDVSYATISQVWNHRTDSYDKPKALCPMCGKRFVPDRSVLESIEKICKDMTPGTSPCLNLDKNAWDVEELKGHTCPHCRNNLRFTPFIS